MVKDNTFNPTRSRIRVLRLKHLTNVALTCRNCETPDCITACPRKALTQSEENGVIIVNDDRCTGCGWCIEACKFGAICMDPEKKVVRICDLCSTRENGPACVEWCPEGALELTSKDILSQNARIDAIKRLVKETEENGT